MTPNKPHTLRTRRTPQQNPWQAIMESEGGAEKPSREASHQIQSELRMVRGKGLLEFIICAARLPADYPALEAYVQPDQPDNYPNSGLGARPLADDICNAKTANDTLKRDWAVLSGFRRGMGENIRDALDAKKNATIQHTTTS